MRVYLVGYMSSGKSTVGTLLAPHLGLHFVDMDQEFEAKYRIDIASFFQKYDEALFRRLEQQLLHDVSNREQTLISTGGGTPCYADNMGQMLRTGTVVYLRVSPAELCRRISQTRKRRPLLVGMKDEVLLHYVTAQLEARSPYYTRAHHILDIDGQTPELVAERLVSILSASGDVHVR